jgi:cyclopropane fatty-acyl-phospholipid synthase-like methyltransferase
MALFQKDIYFYDLKIDFKLKIFKKLFALKKLHLKKKNLKNVDYKDFPKNIDFVYSARFLHYLTYEEAEDLFRKFSKNMKKNGKVFITVSGINSDIGKDYSCKKNEISKRNCFLSKSNQKRFEIKEKVTLYKKDELENLIKKYFEIEES